MQDWPLLGLFLSSFISATLFPGGSEAVLAYLDSQNSYAPMVLLAIATCGNTLGGMTSWALGRWFAYRFPPEKLQKPSFLRASNYVRKFGSPALFFSWIPVIGDPLCVAAGWLRVSLFAAVFWISLGKALRYAAVIGIV